MLANKKNNLLWFILQMPNATYQHQLGPIYLKQQAKPVLAVRAQKTTTFDNLGKTNNKCLKNNNSKSALFCGKYRALSFVLRSRNFKKNIFLDSVCYNDIQKDNNPLISGCACARIPNLREMVHESRWQVHFRCLVVLKCRLTCPIRQGADI